MNLVKKSGDRWALSPRRKAREYHQQIRFLGAFWDPELKYYCVDERNKGKRILNWIKEHETRYPQFAVR